MISYCHERGNRLFSRLSCAAHDAAAAAMLENHAAKRDEIDFHIHKNWEPNVKWENHTNQMRERKAKRIVGPARTTDDCEELNAKEFTKKKKNESRFSAKLCSTFTLFCFTFFFRYKIFVDFTATSGFSHESTTTIDNDDVVSYCLRVPRDRMGRMDPKSYRFFI